MLRAVEIHFGNPALIEHPAEEKETTTALREISMGKVVMKIKGQKVQPVEDITSEDDQASPAGAGVGS